ncbi:TrkH family potassium uptake protein [Planctomycetota bacterium]|nr:TrkH family potassium uptake protein [Planctomycetota bacterium]
MRVRSLFAILGLLLLVLSGIMLIPLGVSWFMESKEDYPAFLLSIAITFTVGAVFWILNLNNLKDIRVREAFTVVGLSWVMVSFFGALPFWLSPSGIPNLLDAYFETMSGFTTTGATILKDVEVLSPGLLFWRSLTQWLGGMGFVLLTLAVMPLLGSGGVHMYRAEIPGPTKEKLTPRVTQTALYLWGLYLLFTVLEILMLMPAIGWFDAITHSLSTLSTGGFSTKNASIAAFDSAYVDAVVTVFMLLASINFVLHYRFLFQFQTKSFFDGECRFFIGVALTSMLFITVALTFLTAYPAKSQHPEIYSGLGECFRVASFQVATLFSGCGFVTADFDHWPNICRVLLAVLMMIGGCAGSTTGGVKVVRFLTLMKFSLREIALLIRPQAVISLKLNGNNIEREVVSRVLGFLALWLLLFLLSVALMSFIIDPGWSSEAGSLDAVEASKVSGAQEDDHLVTAFGATLATLTNVGPGFGGVGPMENYADIPVAGKVLLILLMLLGRLEIYAVLVIFLPFTWRR